jgi:hypothetical protein
MRAGALAAAIAHTVPAPLAAAIAGPLAGIVTDAVAILVNRVRPGALVLTGALSRPLAGIVTHTIAILVNIFACALTLIRPLALLGKGGRCGGNQSHQRECQDECYSPCSCMHDTISLCFLDTLACSAFSKPALYYVSRV